MPKTIYFGGAAFSCAYYIGVVKALRELYLKEHRRSTPTRQGPWSPSHMP